MWLETTVNNIRLQNPVAEGLALKSLGFCCSYLGFTLFYVHLVPIEAISGYQIPCKFSYIYVCDPSDIGAGNETWVPLNC